MVLWVVARAVASMLGVVARMDAIVFAEVAVL